jgi:hypothetical protein
VGAAAGFVRSSGDAVVFQAVLRGAEQTSGGNALNAALAHVVDLVELCLKCCS